MKKVIGYALKILKGLAVITVLLLLGSATYYYYQQSQRPNASNISQSLWQGIQYQRIVRKHPRLHIIHLLEIDLSTADVRFFVSAKNPSSSLDTLAQTTSEFVRKTGVQIAINGAFFDPFYINHLFDYAPRSGESTNILGLSLSNGHIVSNDYLDWAVFCATGKQLSINPMGCPANTQQAVSGRPLLIHNGKLTAYLKKRSYNRTPQPRTAIALSKDKQKVWLIVIDGRQNNYSEGVNLRELSDFLLSLGADSALNLDGGGSSTMAINNDKGIEIINAPFHTKIPMRERPVANHLGVYVQ